MPSPHAPVSAPHVTARPTVGVLIRFSNSAQTLPDVLAALRCQTVSPDLLVGVDSACTDHSRQLIEAAGGRILPWPHAYEHAKVLNFGLRHLDTDLVLVLSSHTVLDDPETLARMIDAMRDPRTACVSLKWDADPHYTDAITWDELRAKGLKFGSIYSNSMGMLRRSLWEQTPFDESLDTAEDYAWALTHLKQGHLCRRLKSPFHYKRSGAARDGEFARIVFGFARLHGLKVAWLGVLGTLKEWWKALLHHDATATTLHQARLRAWAGF